jgi:hypothetical protein
MGNYLDCQFTGFKYLKSAHCTRIEFDVYETEGHKVQDLIKYVDKPMRLHFKVLEDGEPASSEIDRLKDLFNNKTLQDYFGVDNDVDAMNAFMKESGISDFDMLPDDDVDSIRKKLEEIVENEE